MEKYDKKSDPSGQVSQILVANAELEIITSFAGSKYLLDGIKVIINKIPYGQSL